MCSICGIINYNYPSVENSEIINLMNNTQSHRGPDASGTICVQNAALGHRRLSIIDIRGGNQPMLVTYKSKTYVIIYNGELYNTPTVRRKLIAEGNIPDSTSDTEILLRSYIQWGSECLNVINGIFAFAIWDTQKEEIFIARDNLGVKPLFYSLDNGELVFASEIKGILKNPIIKPQFGKNQLCELIGISPARTPGKTLFNNIFELKRGHYLEFSKSGVSIKKYWDINAVEHKENFQDTIAHVRYMVNDSIERQLVSDVELGCFLSGGLDSSIISAIASNKYKKEGKQLKTFSVDFVGNTKNFKPSIFQPDADANWINTVRDYIDSEHRDTVLSSESLIDSLADGVRARDLPGMADIDTSLLKFCKEVKKHVKVALSGECADEIFGGYPWYHNPSLYENGIFPWGGDLDFRKSLIKEDVIKKINLESYVKQSYDMCSDSASILDSDSEDEIARRKMFMLNIDYFMANLLERKDRMSMACGLEVRVPFCDYKLVEYAYNIPWDIKSLDNREKGVLRKAANGWLPQSVIERKKSPYPKTFDPKYTKLVIDMFKVDVLNKPDAKIFKIFDKKALQRLIKPPYSEKPWFGQLMATPQLIAFLWQVSFWFEEYDIEINI